MRRQIAVNEKPNKQKEWWMPPPEFFKAFSDAFMSRGLLPDIREYVEPPEGWEKWDKDHADQVKP